jgi:hypothetical protein
VSDFGQRADNPGMKAPNQKATALLDNAVDLLFRIHMMRGECCVNAKKLIDKKPTDYLALDDCARLEETLATAYRSLQGTLRSINRSRARRGKAAS